MRQSTFDSSELERLAIDLFNVEKQEQELKGRKAVPKGRIIVMMERNGLKIYRGTRMTVTHDTKHQQRFFGGVKKFTKEFGAEIAEKWFKWYNYDSVKVRLKAKRKTGKTKKEK